MSKYDRCYKRDGRSPVPSDPKVSYTMSRIRAKNTKPEMAVRRALWASGIRGYRLHPKSIPGKPDITFIGKRLAVFVHGCYWHCCPHCQPQKPKSNATWWKDKLAKNVERDRKKEEQLLQQGWNVITVWECEVRADLSGIVRRVSSTLVSSSS